MTTPNFISQHLAQAELIASSSSSSSSRQLRTPTQQPQQQISAVDLANALSFATMTQPGSGKFSVNIHSFSCNTPNLIAELS